MACAIETLVDLNTLALEELIGRLKAAEERYDLDGAPPGLMAAVANCSSRRRSGLHV